MSIIITGQGQTCKRVYEEAKKTEVSQKISFENYYCNRKMGTSDDTIIAIIEGIPFDEFLRNHPIANEIIPIFVDVNKINIFGVLKQNYSYDEVCSNCMINRYKSIKNINLYMPLYNSKAFPKESYLLNEDVELFWYGLSKIIKNKEILQNYIEFDTTMDLFRSTEIEKFNNCNVCNNVTTKSVNKISNYLKYLGEEQ